MNGLYNQLQGNLTPEQMRINEELQYRATYGDQAFAERKANELSKESKARLRDEFAMAALSGFIAKHKGMFSFTEAAKDSYEMADLMLSAREVNP